MANKDRTLYCGNLSEKVTEDLLYELFLQAGPLENVTIPKDKDGRPRRFAFITFKHAVSVPYTVALMNGISLYGKVLTLDARTGAQAEHNPYLEKLMQYRNPAAHQNTNMNYNLNQREPYEDTLHRYDTTRRYELRPDIHTQRVDYNSWNLYPPLAGAVLNSAAPSAYPTHVQNQPRFIQNCIPQAMVSYPYANRMPWSRNR